MISIVRPTIRRTIGVKTFRLNLWTKHSAGFFSFYCAPYNNANSEPEFFLFFHWKHYQLVVSAIYKSQRETNNSETYFCPRLYFCLSLFFLFRIDYRMLISIVSRKKSCLVHCRYYHTEFRVIQKINGDENFWFIHLSPSKVLVADFTFRFPWPTVWCCQQCIINVLSCPL